MDGYKPDTMALDELPFTPGSGAASGPDLNSAATDDQGALLLIRHVTEHPEISIAGDLDVPAAARLREAVELALGGAPSSLTIDGRSIGRIGVAGLNTIADSVALCRDRGVHLDLCLSDTARSVLDSVGLWWLGVIDRGPALEEAIRDARVGYGQRLELN